MINKLLRNSSHELYPDYSEYIEQNKVFFIKLLDKFYYESNVMPNYSIDDLFNINIDLRLYILSLEQTVRIPKALINYLLLLLEHDSSITDILTIGDILLAVPLNNNTISGIRNPTFNDYCKLFWRLCKLNLMLMADFCNPRKFISVFFFLKHRQQFININNTKLFDGEKFYHVFNTYYQVKYAKFLRINENESCNIICNNNLLDLYHICSEILKYEYGNNKILHPLFMINPGNEFNYKTIREIAEVIVSSSCQYIKVEHDSR